jgi:hypothetical protein
MADEDGAGAFKGKFVNFLFTSVLAGLVTTAFTYKTWREQTRLDLAKARLAEATETFDKASQLMSKRIYHSYRVALYIDGDDDATFAARIEKLDTTIEEWNLGYADSLQDFQFALEIDDEGRIRPYSEISTRDFEKNLGCDRAFDESNRPKRADWNSPSWLLAALHHCFIKARVRQTALELRQKPLSRTVATRGAAPTDASNERQQKIDTLDRSIDDLKTHAEHVRVVGKKAIQRLREGAETYGFLKFLRSW